MADFSFTLAADAVKILDVEYDTVNHYYCGQVLHTKTTTWTPAANNETIKYMDVNGETFSSGDYNIIVKQQFSYDLAWALQANQGSTEPYKLGRVYECNRSSNSARMIMEALGLSYGIETNTMYPIDLGKFNQFYRSYTKEELGYVEGLTDGQYPGYNFLPQPSTDLPLDIWRPFQISGAESNKGAIRGTFKDLNLLISGLSSEKVYKLPVFGFPIVARTGTSATWAINVTYVGIIPKVK
ncbi:MAG: hypothetical protein NC131_11520 [Roseburia sp.]|nr:hypothetical protein [Roseburia sp.]